TDVGGVDLTVRGPLVVECAQRFAHIPVMLIEQGGGGRGRKGGLTQQVLYDPAQYPPIRLAAHQHRQARTVVGGGDQGGGAGCVVQQPAPITPAELLRAIDQHHRTVGTLAQGGPLVRGGGALLAIQADQQRWLAV